MQKTLTFVKRTRGESNGGDERLLSFDLPKNLEEKFGLKQKTKQQRRSYGLNTFSIGSDIRDALTTVSDFLKIFGMVLGG